MHFGRDCEETIVGRQARGRELRQLPIKECAYLGTCLPGGSGRCDVLRDTLTPAKQVDNGLVESNHRSKRSLDEMEFVLDDQFRWTTIRYAHMHARRSLEICWMFLRGGREG